MYQCTCTPASTGATLTATFGGGGNGVQTGSVCSDADCLQDLDGHAVKAAACQLFIARRVNGSNAGVTRVDISLRPLGCQSVGLVDGRIPLSGSVFAKIVSGTQFCRANQVVWEAGTNDLLVTLENLPCASPNNLGVVKRLDLDQNPPTVTNEFSPGLVADPAGLAIIPSGRCNFGNAGELLLTESFTQGEFIKYGVDSTTSCPVGTKTIFDPLVLIFAVPMGIAVGDFNGAPGGVFGAYLARSGTNEIWLITATNPAVYTHTVWSTGSFFQPDNVVFDPYSPSLFVSEEADPGRIWRIKPDGSETLFATSLKFPQGISFHPRGVMLVSERSQARLTVLDGWRNKFNRGDCNVDGNVGHGDIDCLNDYVFTYGEPEACPTCLDACDVDDNGILNTVDRNALIAFINGVGPPPAAPHFGSSPGEAAVCNTPIAQATDRTIDLLGCNQYKWPSCAVSW